MALMHDKPFFENKRFTIVNNGSFGSGRWPELCHICFGGHAWSIFDSLHSIDWIRNEENLYSGRVFTTLSNNFVGDGSNIFNVALHHISLLEKLGRLHETAHTGRCTGQDHIAREQSTKLRTPRHNFIGIENQLLRTGILLGVSIDFASQMQIMRIGNVLSSDYKYQFYKVKLR